MPFVIGSIYTDLRMFEQKSPYIVNMSEYRLDLKNWLSFLTMAAVPVCPKNIANKSLKCNFLVEILFKGIY